MSDFDRIGEMSSDQIKIKQRIEREAPPFQARYFETIKKNSKINPSRVSKIEFTKTALFKILNSIALLPDFLDVDYIIQLIIKNYDFDNNKSSELFYAVMDIYVNIEHLFSSMKSNTERLRRTHQYKDLINIYRGFLKPSRYEQKNFGEVYTPFELIEKVLAEFPSEFWTNPDSKFLDPAAGMGGFLAIAYSKFWSGISNRIRNPEQRHHHIVNNMLYAAELDTTNVELLKMVFGDELHIFHGDSIHQLNPVEHFGVEGFNGIGSNFPFEKQQARDAKKHAGDSLWPYFIKSTMTNWLLPGGYSGMLVPPGWRKPSDTKSRSSNLWSLLTRLNTVKYIEMFDREKSKVIFNNVVSIQFDLIVVVKEQSMDRTQIFDKQEVSYNVDLHNMPWLPNSRILRWNQLMNKSGDKCNVLYNRTLYQRDRLKQKTIRDQEDEQFRYPVVHGITKSGPTIMYTDEKRHEGGFEVSKVIFNCYGAWNNPILDVEGKYGMSQSAFAIVISSEKEGLDIIRYFTSERLRMFESDLNWATSNPFIFWKLFKDLPKNFYRQNL